MVESPSSTRRGATQRTGGDRRARQPLWLSVDQLLGRTPIRLRRRADKVRVAVHLLTAVALLGLTAWWVLPTHAFAGPVLMVFAPGRGVHLGDLPSLGFVTVAVRSLGVVARIARA